MDRRNSFCFRLALRRIMTETQQWQQGLEHPMSAWWCSETTNKSPHSIWIADLMRFVEFAGLKNVCLQSYWCPESLPTLFWRSMVSLKRSSCAYNFPKAGYLSCLDQRNKLCHQKGILHILTQKWSRIPKVLRSLLVQIKERLESQRSSWKKKLEGDKDFFSVWMVEGWAERKRRRMRRNEEWDSELQIWLFNRVGED